MNTQYGTKVEIINNYQNGGIEVWVFEYTPTQQYNINTNENGEIVKIEMPEVIYFSNGKFKPFLFMPRRLGTEIMKEMNEWQKVNGVKSVDQNFTEGKLQATENHLEDMCRIVNKLLKL